MSGSIEVPEYVVDEVVRVVPARTALIVVDMQNDFVRKGGSLLVPDAEATIPAIKRLLELAHGSVNHTNKAMTSHTCRGDPL